MYRFYMLKMRVQGLCTAMCCQAVSCLQLNEAVKLLKCQYGNMEIQVQQLLEG